MCGSSEWKSLITLDSGFTIETDVSLKLYTSWLVGGLAEFFALPKSVDELKSALLWASKLGHAVSIIGGGTNVLISDDGVRGLTICLRKFSGSQVFEIDTTRGERRLIIECLSGTSKSELLKIFLKHRLEPALFLAGLPGDVGGGIVMNAGVGEMIRPREFVELTDWIEVLRFPSMDIIRLNKADLQWSYRHCLGWQPGIVIRAGLSWEVKPADDILARVKQANQVRLSKQPLDQPSCGSVFVNPVGHKSGQLIEQCSLKGFQIGGAKVSEKHANFIVNTGKATALDIDSVIKHVQTTVTQLQGVDLKTEVVYLGKW
jgi:UDP-N-acetylmuramate dehydrogenase